MLVKKSVSIFEALKTFIKNLLVKFTRKILGMKIVKFSPKQFIEKRTKIDTPYFKEVVHKLLISFQISFSQTLKITKT